jgi:hypothetical protein
MASSTAQSDGAPQSPLVVHQEPAGPRTNPAGGTEPRVSWFLESTWSVPLERPQFALWNPIVA